MTKESWKKVGKFAIYVAAILAMHLVGIDAQTITALLKLLMLV